MALARPLVKQEKSKQKPSEVYTTTTTRPLFKEAIHPFQEVSKEQLIFPKKSQRKEGWSQQKNKELHDSITTSPFFQEDIQPFRSGFTEELNLQKVLKVPKVFPEVPEVFPSVPEVFPLVPDAFLEVPKVFRTQSQASIQEPVKRRNDPYSTSNSNINSHIRFTPFNLQNFQKAPKEFPEVPEVFPWVPEVFRTQSPVSTTEPVKRTNDPYATSSSNIISNSRDTPFNENIFHDESNIDSFFEGVEESFPNMNNFGVGWESSKLASWKKALMEEQDGRSGRRKRGAYDTPFYHESDPVRRPQNYHDLRERYNYNNRERVEAQKRYDPGPERFHGAERYGPQRQELGPRERYDAGPTGGIQCFRIPNEILIF